MKRNILSIFAIGAVLFSSCVKQLDVPQKGVIGQDEFYLTTEDALQARTAMYEAFVKNLTGIYDSGESAIYTAFPLMLNEAADDVIAAGEFYGDNDFGAAINEFRYDTNNQVINQVYKRLYELAYKANLVIDNFSKSDDTAAQQYVAEARAMRAFCHFYLAVLWGTPPQVDHVLTPTERAPQLESQEALLKWVAEEAKDAATKCPDKVDANSAAIMTKWAAYAIAGKAFIQMHDYKSAAECFKAIIDSKKYELVAGDKWETMFHANGKDNKEFILQPGKAENTALGNWSGPIQRGEWMMTQFWNWRTDHLASWPNIQGIDGWGGGAIRGSFAEDWDEYEHDSYRRKGTFFTPDEWIHEAGWKDQSGDEVRGERCDTSVFVGISGGTKGAAYLYGQDRYMYRKLIAWKEDVPKGNWGFRATILCRYADVLLLYAECAANGAGDAALGKQYLNDVQKRANAPVTDLSIDNVKRERQYEFWGEGLRWIDMCRYKEFDGVKDNGKTVPVTYDAFWTKGESTHRLYSEPSTPNSGTVGFQAGKHELFPIPYCETSLNPDIKQNPGW
ncbi:MAG: RagB/SusD family nutrient uptake outer membrane protein [Bacteroidales bacterium]|mgnify:FL=1|nr:RagB/SusD family nutrient uptake outer membrane protein [Bacteroidales bacterium]